MSRTLINPAILAYTLFIKFADWRNRVPLVIFTLLPTFVLCTVLVFPHPTFNDENSKQALNVIKGYFSSQIVCMFVSYLFISDGFAGRKIIADSETMALLFTRPITRVCYVLSKFLGGFIGTSVIFLVGFAISLATAAGFGLSLHSIHPLDFATLLCNAATFSALMVFLHSANPLIGAVTYFFLMGASGMGNMYTSYEASSNNFVEMTKSVCLFISEWFGDFVATPINLTALVSASFLDTYDLIVFATNIVFFLLLASFALSIREFSYGAE